MQTTPPSFLPSPRCPLGGLLNKLPFAPLRLRESLLPSILIPLLSLSLHAGVDYRWTVETSARPVPVEIPIMRGETMSLSATMLTYGSAVTFPTNTGAILYWQTNGMDSTWWTVPGTLASNVLSATWIPAYDTGATLYTAYLAATNATSGRSYRAHGRLRMIGSPGESSGGDPPVPTATWDARYDLAGTALTISNAFASALQSESAARVAGDAAGTQHVAAAIAAWAPTATVARAGTLVSTNGRSWVEVDGTNVTRYTVSPSSNVIVTATSGDGYNGPPLGTTWTGVSVSEFCAGFGATNGWTLYINLEAVTNIYADSYWCASETYSEDPEETCLVSEGYVTLPATLTRTNGAASLMIDWIYETNAVQLATEPTVVLIADAAATNAARVAALESAIPAGGWRNEHYWYIDMEERPRIVTETWTETNMDAISYTDTAGIGMIDWQIVPTVLRGFPSPDFTYGVQGDGGTIDQNGLLTMESVGLVDVLVSNATVKTAAVDLYYSSEGTTTVRSSVDRMPGSAGYAAITNIDSRLAVGGANAYWLTNSPALGVHVRNPACWAAAADLSGVVVSTAGGTPAWHGTLLTTNHIIMSKHAYDGVGTTKRFVGRSGTNYQRSVAAIHDPYPGQSYSKADFVIARLNAGLPAGDVRVYPVLPAAHTNQFPTGFTRLPAMAYDQGANCIVGEMLSTSSFVQPAATNRLAHFTMPYSGDSGRPVFLWLDEGLVFAFVFTTASGGVNAPVQFRTQMAALLATDGAALTDADLSGYTGTW